MSPSPTISTLGAASAKIDNAFGFALQAGIDIPVNESGLGISLDAKRYFLSVDAKWHDANGAKVLETKHNLDPWVLSAGLAFKF